MSLLASLSARLQAPCSLAPLVVYRWLFGCLVLYGWGWSLYKGDLQTRYLEPTFFFHYYGLEWLPPPSEGILYGIYAAWLLGGIGIILGAWYRCSMALFFTAFTYLHLVDATNYINHYYAISLFALLLGLAPAHCWASVDSWRKPHLRQSHAPVVYLWALRAQVAIIYGFAALAKCHPDWLFRALPLRIWFVQSQDFPLIGGLLGYWEVAWLASWGGMLFDATIVGWLSIRKIRPWAYAAVWGFHGLTGWLFNIGLFPWVMITATVLFFSGEEQREGLTRMGWRLPRQATSRFPKVSRGTLGLLTVYFVCQLALPLRHYVLYTGNPLWTEEGYRFSWWVMLVEKEGTAQFIVEDPSDGRQWLVDNKVFLTPFQEKRMSVRPDHLLQFAHYLAGYYREQYQIVTPVVRAEVYVTLNGRMSQRLIDPKVNLAAEARTWRPKSWILPLEEAPH